MASPSNPEKPGVAPSVVGPDDRTIIRSSDELDEPTPTRRKYAPPYLVVVDGPRVGARFPLQDGPNIIGRAVGNAIRLDDQSVSRQHSELSRGTTGWTVKDLGSKNGTFVNGSPITETVVLGHKDLIKTGIYVLRLITQETPLEEEMILPPEYVAPDRTIVVQLPPDSLTGSVSRTSAEEEALGGKEGEEVPTPQAGDGEKQGGSSRRRQWILLGVSLCCVVLALLYLSSRFLGHKKPEKIDAPQELPAAPESTVAQIPKEPPSLPAPLPPPSEGEGKVGGEVTSAASQAAPQEQLVPIFLDFVSSPLPAEVTFQEKALGRTPLRVNVELLPNTTYTAAGLFEMPEIKEQFTQQVEFTVDPSQSVIPILFRGPIGMVRVDNLPRDVQFYLEGNFDYDRFKERSAKLSEVILQKPIYIPYGHYILELRRARKLGESSQTFVQDIIYRREFALGAESPTYVLSVNDQELGVFPVEIRSDPLNADVFIDGAKVGKTPFSGIFPLGEHRMSIRKDGYFEHSETLKVDINTPFSTEVTLETSVAGGHINNARAALGRAMYQDAINELAEALAGSPTPSEMALANLLIGQTYLKQGDAGRALGYFQKAKENEEQRYPAMLGMVSCYAIQGKLNDGLPLLVEVMLKVKDEGVKREANDLFQKISPFKSVIYVYSDPPGAKVTVNDKMVAQETPVILHELPLGNYRLKIEKPGYLPTDLNLSLSVNEFNPVIVKLKPIPR